MKSTTLQSLIVSALLAVAVIAVFAPVTGYEFINIDDAEYVRENPNINHGISVAGIKWAFENSVTGNWHPLTMLSLMLDCQIYGLSAGGIHFTNLLLHIVNTLLLFWLLLAMTRRKSSGASDSSSNLWPSALVAGLFALHPLHVESVTWISERKDLLSAFFFLLTVWAYFKYTAQAARRKTWYVASITLFALGLMCKPMLVTVPFVLLLLDFWPLNRLAAKASAPANEQTPPPAQQPASLFFLIIEKLPFLAISIGFCVLTILTQKSAGAIVALSNLTWDMRLESVMISYAHYLARVVWPVSLAMLYPWFKWTNLQVGCATAIFAGLSLLALRMARRKPYVFVGWFLFVGMLVPAIGFVQVGQTFMADHHTYLPLIGIFIAVAWALADFAASPARRTIAVSAAALAIAAIIPLAAVQVRYWKNSETLFTHSLQVTDKNSTAHYILGALLDTRGQEDLAAPHFVAAVTDNPVNIKARCALGHIYFDQGKFDEATGQYQVALEIDPNSAKAHFGLGEILTKQRQLDPAMEQYFLALKSNPNIPEAHYKLAALYSAKQDTLSTISQLQQAIELAPDYVLALNNLGWILATQPAPSLRNGAEAMRLATHAVDLTGKTDPSTLDTLAAAYAETGEFKKAVDTAELAIQNANTSGQSTLAVEIGTRLKLYQSQQAYRE